MQCVIILPPQAGVSRVKVLKFGFFVPSLLFTRRYFLPTGLDHQVFLAITKRCTSLETFSISYDHINMRTPLSKLPSTLTHLSLPYCTVNQPIFRFMLRPGKQLQMVMVLFFSGCQILLEETHPLSRIRQPEAITMFLLTLNHFKKCPKHGTHFTRENYKTIYKQRE